MLHSSLLNLQSAQHDSGTVVPIIRSSRLYRWLQHMAHKTLFKAGQVVWCGAVGYASTLKGVARLDETCFVCSEKSETRLMKRKITLNSIAQQIFYYTIFHKCFMIWWNFSLMKCIMQLNLNIFVIPSPCMCDVNLTIMQLSKKNSETL